MTIKGKAPSVSGDWYIKKVSKQTKLAIRRYALDAGLDIGEALDEIIAKKLKKYL